MSNIPFMSEPKNETAVLREKEFNRWLPAFALRLKTEKPFALTDKAIDEFVSSLQGAFAENTLPRSFSFEKFLSVVVFEAMDDCSFLVDDFPELESEQSKLRDIAQEVRENLSQEHEDFQDTTETSVLGENINELKKTVLNYDTEGPNTPPEIVITSSETEEHLRNFRENRN